MSRPKWLLMTLVFVLLCGFARSAEAQQQRTKTHVITPKSSEEVPKDLGLRAHTNLLILNPSTGKFSGTAQPQELPPFAGYFYETPASIACVYHLVPHRSPGCNPNQTTKNPSGGGGAIAIVDAYDDPNAASDLAVFSTQFGLPVANFTVVYANGTQPAQDSTGGWELEESLDIEWSHAMAPRAKIFLVEAASDSLDDLFGAVVVAGNLVASNGGGEVSMSWGGGEFLQETQFDGIFTVPGVVYVASAGDNPGVIYPSASPNVVAAGGTSISRDPNFGTFLYENTWQDGGGGPSQVEPRPKFQNEIAFLVGPTRGLPDISFDANPNTGVWIYDSNNYEGEPFDWGVVGGTSVSAPSLAGIFNAAGKFQRSSAAENAEIYRYLENSNAFRDITYGNCGYYIGDLAAPGWDFCTGVGSPYGYEGK